MKILLIFGMALVQSHVPFKVIEIINWNGPNWNIDPIKDLISNEDHLEILKIPLYDENLDDRLIWPVTTLGCYYAKSGYNFFHSKDYFSIGTIAHSSYTSSGKVWKNLWRIGRL